MNNTDHQTALAIKGWKIEHMTPAEIHNAHRFYLVEPEKQTLCQIIMVQIHAFKAISAAPSATQYANFLNQALLTMTTDGMDIEPEQFVTILTSYYKATNTYKNTMSQYGSGESMDVLINLYGTVGSLSTAIRPVALAHSPSPYSTDDILELANYVMLKDREENPNYFMK